jgi:cation diffusion facilitator CzcD-associated flavoprotein CzcO
VAVIGTGSTASQLVPPMAEQAAAAARVPAHGQLGAAALRPPYNALDRLLAHFPPYAALVRWKLDAGARVGPARLRRGHAGAPRHAAPRPLPT